MIFLEIPGESKAFARAGSRGGVRFTPKPQRDYANLIKILAGQKMAGRPPAEGPIAITIRAEYLMPKSWPKKRHGERWKTSKPDADNLVKLAKDALTGIVYRDDAQVASVSATKEHGQVERLLIEVSKLCPT